MPELTSGSLGSRVPLPFPPCFTMSWEMDGTDPSAAFDMAVAWQTLPLVSPPNAYAIAQYAATPIPTGTLEVTAPPLDLIGPRQVALANPGAFYQLFLAVQPTIPARSFTIKNMVCSGAFPL